MSGILIQTSVRKLVLITEVFAQRSRVADVDSPAHRTKSIPLCLTGPKVFKNLILITAIYM